MYVPHAFAPDESDLWNFVEQESFGTLISISHLTPKTPIIAAHVPLLLERNSAVSPYRLVGHLARANPLGEIADQSRVLAIFAGPHAYISPSWYQSPNQVPTWNYVAVHVYGTLEIETDRDQRAEIVRQTVDFFEAKRKPTWSLDQVDETHFRHLLEAIIAFRITVDHVEGAWKLSQNRKPLDRAGAIAGLQRSESSTAQQMADLMRQISGDSSTSDQRDDS